MEEIGDELFFILFDESHDVSIKEQTVITLRYVHFKWHIIEHFLGILYASDTTVLSFKAAIEALFFKRNLSMSRIYGKDYDGANNM